VSPTVTTTYTLTATNSGGTTTAQATVTVDCPHSDCPGVCHPDNTCTPPPPTITSFKATPSTIYSGEVSTLSWVVSGATSLSIDQTIGPVTPLTVGNHPVSPTVTTTYTLTATNSGGTTTAQATVTVDCPHSDCPGVCHPDQTCTPPPPKINSFTATPKFIYSGEASMLTWDVNGANSLSIDQTIGPVLPLTIGSHSVNPAMTTTYTLTATNSGGTSTAQATVTLDCSKSDCPAGFCQPDNKCTAPKPPTILNGPTADPSPTYGTTTHLTVVATGDNGESKLAYHWDTLGNPPAKVTFSGDNSSNLAKNTTATFQAVGTYTFQVTVTDTINHLFTTGTVDVQVIAKTIKVVVSPKHAVMHVGDSLPFNAAATDQFGKPVNKPATWSASPGGAISYVGLLTVQPVAPKVTVTGTIDGASDTGDVTVLVAGAAVDISNAYGFPVPWKSTMGLPITFKNLAAGSHIRIFTADGRLVKELDSPMGAPTPWHLDNMDGERVASWVYFYIIDNPNTGETKKGKLVIIQ
jgi:hypothetical protein